MILSGNFYSIYIDHHEKLRFLQVTVLQALRGRSLTTTMGVSLKSGVGHRINEISAGGGVIQKMLTGSMESVLHNNYLKFVNYRPGRHLFSDEKRTN